MENIVTLRDELSNIKNYFFIQQFRFEDRFFLDIQVEDGDDELLDCLLPKMTLQPIVENCVFHGLEPQSRAGTRHDSHQRHKGYDENHCRG